MAWTGRKAAAALALLVVVLGIVMALVPLSIERKDRLGETISCGTAIEPNILEALGTEMGVNFANELAGVMTFGPDSDFVRQCESRIRLQQGISFPVGGVGLLTLAFIGLTAKRRPKAGDQRADIDVNA